MFAVEKVSSRKRRISDGESKGSKDDKSNDESSESPRVKRERIASENDTIATNFHHNNHDFNKYINQLEGQKKLLATILQVPSLSSVLNFHSNEAISINGNALWIDLQQQYIQSVVNKDNAIESTPYETKKRSVSTTAAQFHTVYTLGTPLDMPNTVCGMKSSDLQETARIDLFRKLLLSIMSRLDAANVREEIEETYEFMEILNTVRDAVGFVTAKLLDVWDTIADDPSALLIDALIQNSGIGVKNAFHEHHLIISAAQRVFQHSLSWNCSICDRQSDVKGFEFSYPVTYRCAGCDINLCRECFTRQPNLPTPVQSEEKDPLRVNHLLTFMIKHLDRDLSERVNMLRVKLALAIRSRLYELPVYRPIEMAPMVELFIDLLSSPIFSRQLVSSPACIWLHSYISPIKLKTLTFLGPFLTCTSMSDEPLHIDHLTEGKDAPATTLTLGWQKGYRKLKHLVYEMVSLLLSDDQDMYVVDATICWLSCCVAAAARRWENRGAVDMMDGFYINFSSILVQLALPILSSTLELEKDTDFRHTIDFRYHMAFEPRRVYGCNERPLREQSKEAVETARVNADGEQRQLEQLELQNYKLRCADADGLTRYYPLMDHHSGVVCDNCGEKDFKDCRYKCCICDDFDICGPCHQLYTRQTIDQENEESLTVKYRGYPRLPSIHPFGHVFLRINIPVPLISMVHFHALPYKRHDKANIQRFSQDSDDTRCAECECILDSKQIYYKCANCFEPRMVCEECLVKEEQYRNPILMHIPGHLYFAISSNWREVYSPHAKELHYRSLFFPPAVLPRQSFAKDTEIFYMAVKSLHIGPLFTLSRLIATLKEIKELESFCFCEDEKQEMEKQRSKRIKGQSSSHANKKSSHYNASKKRLSDIGASKIMAKMQVLEYSNVCEWLHFYAKTCRWLLGLASTRVDAMAAILTDSISPIFTTFPEHFFFDLCDAVYLVGLTNYEVELTAQSLFADGQIIIEPIIAMFLQLIASSNCTQNPHLRAQALKSLNVFLAFFSQFKDNSIILSVFSNNRLIQQHSLAAVLQFHQDMQHGHDRDDGLFASDGDRVLPGFFAIRVSVSLFIRYLWQIPNQRSQICEVFQPKHNDFKYQVPVIQHQQHYELQASVWLSGLWSDAVKLLEEGNNRISVLKQLRDIHRLPMHNRGPQPPALPAMVDGYIALHSKQLRLTFRLLIEVLEILTWVSSVHPLKILLLKPELLNQAARTIGFLMSTIASAVELNSWDFPAQLWEDGRIVAANLVMLVTHCSGSNCSDGVYTHQRLSKYSSDRMLCRVGDFDTRERWPLHDIIDKLEIKEVIHQSSAMDVCSDYYHEHPATSVQSTDSISNMQDPDMRLDRRFISTLAKDGRFHTDRFIKCCHFVSTTGNQELISSAWVNSFKGVVKRCERMSTMFAAMDEVLHDAPSSYLDPLLSTIMTDPVKLPSGSILDRPVIERHLLSSSLSLDPFTREPLSTDQLEPCDTLRKEIQTYLIKKSKQLGGTKEDLWDVWGLEISDDD